LPESRGSSASRHPLAPAARSGLHSQPTRPPDVIGPSSEGIAEGVNSPAIAVSSDSVAAMAACPQNNKAASKTADSGIPRDLDTPYIIAESLKNL